MNRRNFVQNPVVGGLGAVAQISEAAPPAKKMIGIQLSLSRMRALKSCWTAATVATFKSQTVLQVENLPLLHQLAVLSRSVKRPDSTAA